MECPVCHTVAFAFQAQLAQRDAHIAESAQLAAQSREELARGNRYEALQLALDALSASQADASRPVTDEAVAALRDALGLNTSPTTQWTPAYSLTTDAGISVIDGANMVQRADSDDIWGITTFGSVAVSVGKPAAGVPDRLRARRANGRRCRLQPGRSGGNGLGSPGRR